MLYVFINFVFLWQFLTVFQFDIILSVVTFYLLLLKVILPNYSKVDIMLEYKNMEKGWFFQGEAHSALAVFSVSKTAKILKILKRVFFFRLIKTTRQGQFFFTYHKHRIRVWFWNHILDSGTIVWWIWKLLVLGYGKFVQNPILRWLFESTKNPSLGAIFRGHTWAWYPLLNTSGSGGGGILSYSPNWTGTLILHLTLTEFFLHLLQEEGNVS